MRLCASVLCRPCPELLCSGRVRSDVCRSELLCSRLCCSRSLCSGLCCSRRVRSELLCSGRRSDLLCSGYELLQQRLRSVALLQDAEVPLPQDPLLQGSQELLQHGLLDGLRPDVRRPGLCRSGCLCS